jgi:hypothetical protein
MTNAQPAAFWSYAHEDDEKANGAILKLAELVSDEYSLLTGKELRLFIDTDIKWGEEWQQRIDNALVATTFFIPIVTPRYFTREECLRELFEFTRRASALGIDDLVCPVLFVPVDDLVEGSSDPAKAQIARAQYEDWTRLRLKGPGSPEHIEAVHGLAARLVDVADRVAKRQVAQETERSDENVQASLGDILSEIRRVLPEWQAITETDSVVREQFLAADRLLEERRMKASRRASGARFVIAAKQVQEYMPLIERRAELQDQLLLISATLGPLLTRLFEVAKEHPEEKSLVEAVWQEVTGATDAYVQHDDESSMIAVSKWAKRHSHETRGMLTLADACSRSDRHARELVAQISSWNKDYAKLEEAAEQATASLDMPMRSPSSGAS